MNRTNYPRTTTNTRVSNYFILSKQSFAWRHCCHDHHVVSFSWIQQCTSHPGDIHDRLPAAATHPKIGRLFHDSLHRATLDSFVCGWQGWAGVTVILGHLPRAFTPVPPRGGVGTAARRIARPFLVAISGVMILFAVSFRGQAPFT